MRSNRVVVPVSAFLIAGFSFVARPGDAQTPLATVTPGPIAGSVSRPTTLITQAIPATSTNEPLSANRGSASGISTNPSNNTTGNLALHGVPLPLSGPPLTGLFPSVGEALLADGIDFHGLAFDHFLANPTAGNITGQTYNLGAILPAVDVDLGKLAGITGGNIHAQATFFGLTSDIPAIITDTGGFLTGYQTTPNPLSSPVILSVLTYEQKLLNDRLSIEIGRTNAYHYFLLPNALDIFNDFSSTFNVDGDFSANPFPVWGGRATYHFTPKWYVQGGAFEDNYYRSVYNPDNFGVTGNSGAQILGEVGYRSEFSNADYPANFELGAEWNTRKGYSNIKGAAVIASPFNEATDYPGGGVIFFEGEKVLWRGSKPAFGPPANIALYGSIDASVDKPQPIDMDALAGINFTGVIPGRPFDALGLQVHYQRLSAIEANYETRVQNIFAGPGPSQSRDNYAFEVVGNIALTPWLEFDPTVQYFVNPDNLFDPAQPRRPSDGFMAGAFAVIPLGPLLGTSNKPF
ncbi:carbohydrate porin [Lichenicoccus sp.]|uniref:carbohydrate porin n=1 Tax=Lichenicoccus sp. TaxID=2781899 RepID=UPI003D0A5EA2